LRIVVAGPDDSSEASSEAISISLFLLPYQAFVAGDQEPQT
jgi:hypothetical protein